MRAFGRDLHHLLGQPPGHQFVGVMPAQQAAVSLFGGAALPRSANHAAQVFKFGRGNPELPAYQKQYAALGRVQYAIGIGRHDLNLDKTS